jgi:ubiquinone/menaquinone biosynthesis C-methylase UbiE
MSTHNERELAHWQAWQAKADEVWGWQTPAGQARAERRAALFRELAQMGPTSIVLEVGCGTGEFTHRVAPHVKELWATDLSPELLARAKERIHASCPGAKVVFEVHDATDLKLPGNRFDAVFGCSMLHHLDAAKALKEVFRVLRPGGWCAFSEPNMMNPQIALQKNVGFIKRRVGDSPDETAFFRWQLRRLLDDAGFTAITLRHFDFLHPMTPRRWIPAVAAFTLKLERVPLVRAISGSLIFCARKPEPGKAV